MGALSIKKRQCEDRLMDKICFICGDQRIAKTGKVGIYNLEECVQCGLQFLDPVPDETNVAKIYLDYYKAWNLIKFEKEISDMKTETFKEYLNKIATFVSSGRLLDVGCARGELLHVAKGLGFDVYGVEIAPNGIFSSMGKIGKEKIIGRSLKSGDFPNSFFDVITVSDVFEHIAGPRLFLKIIHDILKPSGILMIVTPNTSSWTRKVLRKQWPHYKEEHVYYYRPSNITQLLSFGFNIIKIENAYKTLTINYLLSVSQAYIKRGLPNRLILSLSKLTSKIRFPPFNINIGEMLILCQKVNI